MKNLSFQRGLNEGYTELLANRIFNNEHYYNDSAYTLNVYLLRIFELLYDNQKDMEKDYFLANYQGPANAFTKYGKIEEYLQKTKEKDGFEVPKEPSQRAARIIAEYGYMFVESIEDIWNDYTEEQLSKIDNTVTLIINTLNEKLRKLRRQ